MGIWQAITDTFANMSAIFLYLLFWLIVGKLD